MTDPLVTDLDGVLVNGPDSNSNQHNATIWPELWQAFEIHRQRVSQLLFSVASGSSSTLCIWGAGRTTDLDLISLLNYYQRIDLVDINASLTQQAMVQRGFDGNPRVRVLPSSDLSGMESHWDEISQMPDEAKTSSIAKLCDDLQFDFEQYDVVVSTCLLSQILQKASGQLGLSSEVGSNTGLFHALKCLREKHLRLMLDHTKPGGTALLISDLTSSESIPELGETGCDLNQVLNAKVLQGNHFHGLNPKLIANLKRLPEFQSKIQDVKVTSPWVWDSLSLKYLCLAFRIRKQKLK